MSPHRTGLPWLIAVSVETNVSARGIYAALLNAIEIHRAARFAREQDRATYIVAHVLKRLMLARLTEQPPGTLQFRDDCMGKPRLNAWSGIDFNLSHTKGLVACACIVSGQVGVDAEHVTHARYAPELAKLVLNQRELTTLATAPDPDRGFLSFWTAKEAAMKVTGKGFQLHPRGIEILEREVLADSRHFHLAHFHPTDDHLVALAWRFNYETSLESYSLSPDCSVLTDRDLISWIEHDYPPDQSTTATR